MDDASALLDVRRMAEADNRSVASGTTIAELMENAGRSVAQEIERRWSPRPLLVLCGPGNNGGDGFVAARYLVAAGWPVRIALLGAREALRGAAQENAVRWNGPLEPLDPDKLGPADLVIDALFGAGLSRALAGAARAALAAVATRRIPIVAIDVPSGLMGDTGADLGAVPATLTVTFLRKKPGHVLLPGRDLCGQIVVTDIGTPAGIVASLAPDTFENQPSLWLADLPRPQQDGNKFTRGHALLYGGYPITGASRLAARAAARAGAGLTSIAVPQVALPIYASALTSIMVAAFASDAEFRKQLDDSRVTAYLIGPGAGVNEETRRRALAMLGTGRATLLDADAISAFAGDPGALARAIHGPCVLTPHEGEFKRLFDFAGDKLTRARAAAARTGVVLVLKGRDTVIAARDGRAIINSNAPPTLATAGSGDVLGGITLGLLAQGMDPFLAAAAAVWLHGAAAASFGPGLLAEDLPDLLPAVLRELEQQWHARQGV
jgi:NAD(P)H-hydrate epimerase